MLTIYEWLPIDILPMPGEVVIAGSPDIAYLLADQSIPFEDFENLELSRSLFEDSADYFHLQKTWLNKLDAFLQAEILFVRKDSLALAWSNYLRLKYILDTAYLQTRTAQLLLDLYKPSKVRLFRKKPPCFSSIFQFSKFSGRPFFQDALEEFCKSGGISFEVIDAPGEALVETSKAGISSPLSILGRRLTKSVYFFFKYGKLLLKPYQTESKGFLFLHAGSPDVDEVVREGIREKRRILTCDQFGLYEESSLRRFFPFLSENLFAARDISQECLAAAELFRTSFDVFYPFFNEKCSNQVFKLIKPIFFKFIEKDCATFICKTQMYAHVLKKAKVDILFARGNTDIDSLSMLLAARNVNKIKTVCIQHASGCLLSDSMSVYNSNTYDITLARDEISKASMTEAWERQRQAPESKLTVSPHYLNWVAKKIRPKFNLAQPYKRILYVEKKFSGNIRTFSENIYAPNEYYNFQKKVIAFFSAKKNIRFIYKHAPGQSWAEQSLLQDIKRLGMNSMQVSSKSFLEELKHADAVITDYPSGSLFEALAVNVPVLCIYPDYFQITKKAKASLDAILQPFNTIDDALRSIEIFLNSPARDYQIQFPLQTNLKVVWDYIDANSKRVVNV